MGKKLEYPLWVCSLCGRLYGRRKGVIEATFHPDTCGVCGNLTTVTEPRDYGHLKDGWQEHGKGGK